jgi:UDP-3-O-[3-hydroxymyristoyl] N-acetylglucosamine deacetylase
VTLYPAAPGTGIVFEPAGRGVAIPATRDRVVASRFATSLGRDGACLSTVEHLLAALLGLGVDDVRVRVEGAELPALDGSAAEWVSLLRAAGLERRGAGVDPLRVQRVVELREGGAWIRAEPAATLRITCGIDFEHPAVGRQRLHLDGLDPERFTRELAPARTFGFLADRDRLRQAGFARGASLANTVVFDGDGVVNRAGLRFPDEPVRHKALDLLGDLALLGRPLEAHVSVERGGHTLHLALVDALLQAQ